MPVIVGGVLLAAVFWAVFLRGDGEPTRPSTQQVEQWRAGVESCLSQRDADCADEALSQLRTSVPSEYWSDLLQRSQQLRQQQQREKEQEAGQQAEAERRQRVQQQQALAQAEQQAVRDQMAAAEAAAELAMPNVPSAAAIADRPPRLDPESQRRNPVHYPPAAARRGSGGTVLLDIDVGPNGSLLRTSVVRSSGDRELDRAAQDAARRWTYEPATSRGQVAFGTLRLPVEFTAPDSSPSRAAVDDRSPASVDPRAPEAGLLDKARAELRAGRFDVALALGESALQMNPASTAARRLIEQARSERERVMSETTIE